MPIDRQRDILALRGLVSGDITELTDNEVQVDTTIGYQSYNFLSSLSKLERVDASRISSIHNYTSSVFEGCAELKYVRLSNVEKIQSRAFYGCAKLQEISLSSALEIDNYAFRACGALATLSMPSVTKIGSQSFYECRSLTTLNLPLVTSVGANAFQNCHGLVNVTLQGITSIGNSGFSNCTHLDTIDLGASVTSIGTSAIYCASLLHLVIRNTSAVCTYNNTSTSYDPSNSQLKIYVPRALLDSYKTATNWSRLASKFVALEDHTTDGTTTGELVKE